MRPGQREAVAGAERSAALVPRQPGRVPCPRVHRPGLRGGALGRAGAGGPHTVRGCWAPPSPILGPSCRDRALLRLSGLFLILFGVSKGQKIRWEAPTCCPGCRFVGRLMGRHLGHPVDLGGGSFSFSALSAARAATSWRWTTSTSASGAHGGSCPRSSRTNRAEGQVGLWQGGGVMGQLGCHRGQRGIQTTPW